MAAKQKLKELQVYSGIAIIFVVLIHSSCSFLNSSSYLQHSYIRWMFYYIDNSKSTFFSFPTIYNFIDRIIHIAVPMFIFIAGFKYAFNFDKNISYKEYLSKKFKRIFKPFFIISLFFIFYYLIIECIKTIIAGKQINFIAISFKYFKAFLKIFIGINNVVPLWYIPMYLLVVLSYPIIVKYLKNDKLRMLLFCLLAAAWVLEDLFIPYVQKHQVPFCFIYYFYLYELGIQFCKHDIKHLSKKAVFIAYAVLLLLSLFINNLSINIIFTEVFFTPATVIAFYYISLLLKESKILLSAGKYSFYIYLFHEPLIEHYISKVFIKIHLYNYYPVIIITTVLTILISAVFYKVLIRTRFGKYMFSKNNLSQKQA